MKVRTTILAAALACAMATPIAANARADVYINVAPPVPPVYAPLRPRAGYVVVPGYYRYDNVRHRHIWVKESYARARRGEHYVGPTWHEANGRYHFKQGHWDRD